MVHRGVTQGALLLHYGGKQASSCCCTNTLRFRKSQLCLLLSPHSFRVWCSRLEESWEKGVCAVDGSEHQQCDGVWALCSHLFTWSGVGWLSLSPHLLLFLICIEAIWLHDPANIASSPLSDFSSSPSWPTGCCTRVDWQLPSRSWSWTIGTTRERCQFGPQGWPQRFYQQDQAICPR